MLMRYRNNSYGIAIGPINNRVRIMMSNNAPGVVGRRCAQRRMRNHQIDRALHGIVEMGGTNSTRFNGVPTCGLGKLLTGFIRECDVQRLCPAMMASISLNTSSAGIHFVRPASMSATRRAISSSHALAMASGESSGARSRLTIR